MLTEKVAVVIGAGSGLGRATAMELAQKGADVIVSALTPEGMEEVSKEIESTGRKVVSVTADARSSESVSKLYGFIEAEFGHLDISICCVGGGLIKPTIETTVEELEGVWKDNMIPVYLCAQAALRFMLPQKSGLIVNIASRAALRAGIVGKGGAPISVYSAAKMAVHGFGTALAREVKESGVNVLCVDPGPMDTPSRRTSTPNFDLARAMKPEKIAGLISYIACNPDVILEGGVTPVSINY